MIPSLPCYINHLETAVPPFSYSQDELLNFMLECLQPPPKIARYLKRIYRQSGIARRHSVIADFIASDKCSFWRPEKADQYISPSTRMRNDYFIAMAQPLYLDLARRVLLNCPDLNAADVTHLITVSCTGFYNPGPDYHIIKELGLADSVERYNLGFMGCYAAFPAFKMAQAFCRADPNAKVLIVAVELCTLHFQKSLDFSDLLSASLFADGGGAALISACQSSHTSCIELGSFYSALIPQGEQDMAWNIGDYGFNMVLSPHIAELIGDHLLPIVKKILPSPSQMSEIGYWAMHPGGRAILDKLRLELKLTVTQAAASRQVLLEYGNMSSATIFFVLRQILDHHCRNSSSPSIAALAFGPGLTVEAGIMTLIS